MKTSNKLLIIGTSIILAGICISTAILFQDVSKNIVKGNGKMVQKTFKFSGFNKAEIHQFKYEFIQSNENKVVATMDENLGAMLKINVKDSQLMISANNGQFFYKNGIKIKVYYSNLTELHSLSGASFTGDFNEPNLLIELESGAISNFSYTGDFLDFKSGSGANSTFTGKAKKLIIVGESGSNIDAKDFYAEACKIELGSGANAEIFASENLDAMASSGASITYYGNPKNTSNIEISSGARIKRGE